MFMLVWWTAIRASSRLKVDNPQGICNPVKIYMLQSWRLTKWAFLPKILHKSSTKLKLPPELLDFLDMTGYNDEKLDNIAKKIVAANTSRIAESSHHLFH